jgi:hypothetical protein
MSRSGGRRLREGGRERDTRGGDGDGWREREREGGGEGVGVGVQGREGGRARETSNQFFVTERVTEQ